MRYLDWSSNMVKEIEHEEIVETAESGKMHNITSKAGRLAMELAAEKQHYAAIRAHLKKRKYRANWWQSWCHSGLTLSLIHI